MSTRRSDFNIDKDKYGSVGEKDLLNILSKSRKCRRYGDLSQDFRFFEFDVDIVEAFQVSVNNDSIYNDLCNNQHTNTDSYILYEVKSDTRGLSTRNIYYEYFDITYNKIGCAERSKCDYFYYVFLNEKNEIIERYLIDTVKLRNFINEYKNLNESDYPPFFGKRKMRNTSGEETLGYIIKIDTLIKQEIAKEVKR